MVEPLDADLLKYLRGVGKPPTFDGNDAEYQDFRFGFRVHMSVVSPVSQTLMDKMRSRTKSVRPGNSESARRSVFEMLSTDVLLVSFDHDRQCANPSPFR